MAFSDPFEIEVPAGARRVGEAPFWPPGETVTWTFRRFDFDRDHAEVRRPMRVIEDGPRGAVLWLAGGSPTTDTRIRGWEQTNPHDVPWDVRFRPPAEAPTRLGVPGMWRGLGVLKIVPAGFPFSVWVLLKEGDRNATDPGSAGTGDVRVEWYVNLEATHRRTDTALFTSDHILDITFPVDILPLHTTEGGLNPTGAVFKDVDELAVAAASGMWPAAWSETIRRNGMQVLDSLDSFDWAFDRSWEKVARDLVDTTRHSSPVSKESRRPQAGCYSKERI